MNNFAAKAAVKRKSNVCPRKSEARKIGFSVFLILYPDLGPNPARSS